MGVSLRFRCIVMQISRDGRRSQGWASEDGQGIGSGDGQGSRICSRWCEKQTSELDWLGELWNIGTSDTQSVRIAKLGKRKKREWKNPRKLSNSTHLNTSQRNADADADADAGADGQRNATQRAKLRGGTAAGELVSLALLFPFRRYKSNAATRLRVVLAC